MKVVSLVTTCDRPDALHRALPQIVALGADTLVVDDSRTTFLENFVICAEAGVYYLRLPTNRGLACALNVGVSYWLADPQVQWISYFQDDVDVSPETHRVLASIRNVNDRPLLTGRHAREHAAIRNETYCGVQTMLKRSSTGTHIYAHRDYWAGVMPIPTRELGAPKRIPGAPRGLGSNVDWWVISKAPNSAGVNGRSIVCVPGLVRTFLVHKNESTWDNEHVAGEDPPLSREAIVNWSPPCKNV